MKIYLVAALLLIGHLVLTEPGFSASMPTISIADASVQEASAGTTNLVFRLQLSAPSWQIVVVSYSTTNGTAIAGANYIAAKGQVTFRPGATNASVTVAVTGNAFVEPERTFFVKLSTPANAGLARKEAVGTILNDRGQPGQLDHFDWSIISSPQFVNMPFTVEISAMDAAGNPATNFSGYATIGGAGDSGPVSLTPSRAGPFTAGLWTGSLAVATESSNIVLSASNNNGHQGSSNPFQSVSAELTFIPAANRTDMVEDSSRGLLYIANGNCVLRYDLTNQTFLTPFNFGTNLCGMDISPDNNTLIVADTAAYNGLSNWVYVVDLPSGIWRQANFSSSFYEGGTYAVAFGNDGAALISSEFLGSGYTPLRRYDPVSGEVTTIAEPWVPSMVSASGDGSVIGVAEGNISDGPVDRYEVAAQAETASAYDQWFNFEIAVNRNGSQFAVPTYGGTFIYDTHLNQLGLVGSYASEGPIGLAYHPQADLVYCAWWPTSFLRVFETHTFAEVADYNCGDSFGWNGGWAFQQGRVRSSHDGNNIFVTVTGGVAWIFRPTLPPADLALTLAASTNSVNAGTNVTYSIAITNCGPNMVTDARIFDRLPDGVTLVSANSPEGTCVQSNGLVTCTFGAFTNGAAATLTVVVLPPVESVLTNSVAVYSGAHDANPDNNFAAALTVVHGTASMAVAPGNGLVSQGVFGGPFNSAEQDYTLTNSGTAALSWTASTTAIWFSLSNTGGTLAPGEATTVSVWVNDWPGSMPPGSYSGSVTFSNLSNGIGTATRKVALRIDPVGILAVTPASGFDSAGPRGGPFQPVKQIYTLSNIGSAPLTWTANHRSGWISQSAVGGFLLPGASTHLTVSIGSGARYLARGFYSDAINIKNVTSGRGNTSLGFTLTADSAPASLPQAVTVPEGGSTAIVLTGTDADHAPLTASITSLPAHGTLYQTVDGVNPTTAITTVPTAVSNPSNAVIYVLSQLGYGSDYGDFTFDLNDGVLSSADATVTVNVTFVDHPPVAANETVPFLVGTTQLDFNVLAYDADVDGNPLMVQSFTSPAHGTLTEVTNGQFRYVPNANFVNGQDQFNYTVADPLGSNATAQVTIRAYNGLLTGGDWPTFGNGPSHTGYYPAMLGGATLVAGWSTNFGGALNQVAVGGGKVYVTPINYFNDSFVIALDSASGQLVWQDSFPPVFSVNPPTYDAGRVYMQYGRGEDGSAPQLDSFDAANGALLWTNNFDAQWERYYAPTVYGGGIWIDGGGYGGMYGFSTNGMELFFNDQLEQYDEWTPAYYQDTVYSWVAGNFRAHDPITGTVLWEVNCGWNWGGWSMNTVAAIDGGKAFVENPPNLTAIDLTARTNIWTLAAGVTGSPAVANGSNGVVYAITGGSVQAFSTENGTSLGFYEANDNGLAWQPIVTDDALFVSSGSATYIFDLASHQLLQTIPHGGPLSIANGSLYIAGQDGSLVVYTVVPAGP
jgi:uncharacterized repeat protein (TIGR01451 family)